MQVLWLVRHGESSWNVRGLAQGHNDEARLTDLGWRQAWGVVGQLSGLPIRALYSSDLHRAMETAAPLAAVLGLAVTRDARLRERGLGAAEGTPTATLSPAVSGLGANRVLDPDARPPGGESVRELYRRVAEFTDELTVLPPFGDAADIAIIAHGGTIRVLDAYRRGLSVEQMAWAPRPNGSILRSPTPRPAHLNHP